MNAFLSNLAKLTDRQTDRQTRAKTFTSFFDGCNKSNCLFTARINAFQRGYGTADVTCHLLLLSMNRDAWDASFVDEGFEAFFLLIYYYVSITTTGSLYHCGLFTPKVLQFCTGCRTVSSAILW